MTLERDDSAARGLWWLSWEQMTSPGREPDGRPVQWPPPFAVCGFWESGSADDDSFVTVVALVRARTESQAAAIITRGWSPGVGRWRFRRLYVEGGPPGDRFPACEWSVERGTWPWLVAPHGSKP